MIATTLATTIAVAHERREAGEQAQGRGAELHPETSVRRQVAQHAGRLYCAPSADSRLASCLVRRTGGLSRLDERGEAGDGVALRVINAVAVVVDVVVSAAAGDDDDDNDDKITPLLRRWLFLKVSQLDRDSALF